MDTEFDINSYIKKCLPNADLYEIEKLKKDWANKEKSADGLFQDFFKRAGDPTGKTVLDIGFGNGMFVARFASAGAIVSGVEVEEQLHLIAKKYLSEKNLSADLQLYDGFNFPFSDNYFDFVYCTSVIEHVDDPVKLLSEIARVLKKGGKLYLSFPNKYHYRDTHTGVYFLNWLPRSWANWLLKKLNKSRLEDWNLHFISFFKVKKIIRKNKLPLSIVYDISAKTPFRRLVKKILAILGIHYGTFLPAVIIVIEKN